MKRPFKSDEFGDELMANDEVHSAKQKRLIAAIQSLVVASGIVIVSIGASGMLGHPVVDTPILGQLGSLVILVVGIVTILAGIFKTTFFFEFLV